MTFLVGENGSGKSTLIEGIAEAFGLPAEGGTTNGGRRLHSNPRGSGRAPLWWATLSELWPAWSPRALA